MMLLFGSPECEGVFEQPVGDLRTRFEEGPGARGTALIQREYRAGNVVSYW
jgi:hypothetical protein